MNQSTHLICSKTVLDHTVPGIQFNQSGVSNYCEIHNKLIERYPRGEVGEKYWDSAVDKMKTEGKNKPYDCIIGMSGGTDSSYLLHVAKEKGLRPLAVNLDNGWNSEISVSNIKKIITALNIDLDTYVIDYEEIKSIMAAYIKAGLPWADAPTDIAIKAILLKKAAEFDVKYVLIGADFRSEGKQPTEWTYSDGKQVAFLAKKFNGTALKSYPNLTFLSLLYYSYIKGIKLVSPFNYINYKKSEAQQLLKEKYSWEYYGGHHHESIFTRFIISYWMPKKFNIDKRKITLSAQILSGDRDRNSALDELKNPPYDVLKMEEDKEYVIKKLGLSKNEFEQAFNSTNSTFLDYPSYYPTILRFVKITKPFLKLILAELPLMFYELDARNKSKN